jgi:hypothetical protein
MTTYRDTPVCPTCGRVADEDWDVHIDMDYYWRGWSTGDTAFVLCRGCDTGYEVECLAVPTFRSYPIPERGK